MTAFPLALTGSNLHYYNLKEQTRATKFHCPYCTVTRWMHHLLASTHNKYIDLQREGFTAQVDPIKSKVCSCQKSVRYLHITYKVAEVQ